jgi:hypothetical protein
MPVPTWALDTGPVNLGRLLPTCGVAYELQLRQMLAFCLRQNASAVSKSYCEGHPIVLTVGKSACRKAGKWPSERPTRLC